MKVRIWSVERSSWWLPGGLGYTKLKSESGVFGVGEAFCLAAGDYGESPQHVLVPLECRVTFHALVTKKECV